MHLPAFEGPRGQVIRVDLFHHAVDDRELGQVVVSGAAVIADVLCSEKQEDQMGGEKEKNVTRGPQGGSLLPWRS